MLLLKENNILTYICRYYAVILTLLYVSIVSIVVLYVYDYHVYGPEDFLCNKYWY